MDKKLLDPYVFRYNSYADEWMAVTRENYTQLYSGDNGDVLRSQDIKVLIELIERTGGEEEKIQQLVGQIDFQKETNF